MEIVKKAFITLVSTFLLIGVIMLIVTGDNLDIKLLIQLYDNTNDTFNFYTKIVKSISTNYDELNNFSKEFFFTSSYLSTMDIVNALNNIPIIGQFFSTIINIVIFLTSTLVMVAELLLKITSFGFVLFYTLFQYMSTSITFMP